MAMDARNSSVVAYKECCKIHTIMGIHTTDGCMTFSPDYLRDGLFCLVCQCHRDFHRKDSGCSSLFEVNMNSFNHNDDNDDGNHQQVSLIALHSTQPGSTKRKYKRYKVGEKEKMVAMGELLGWRMPGRNPILNETLQKLCNEIDITRTTFKAWLHAHKKSKSSARQDGNSDQV